MSGERGFRTDEARFTPITVAGVAAIIGLSGVLAGSVLQSGSGGRSPAPRIASATARSQVVPAVTAMAAMQPAVVPLPSSQPAATPTSLPAVGGAIPASSGQGVVSAATVAPAQRSGFSPAPATVTTASVSSTHPLQVSPAASLQSSPAAVPQFTANVARAAAAPVAAASTSAPASVQASEAQVLGISATSTSGASSGINATTGGTSSVDFGAYGGAAPGLPVNTNPPFPNIKPYTGAITTQTEAYQALGLPADFQFGAEPDPYIVGSYRNYVTDAAAGDKAAQAGLALAESQGANFSGFN